MDDLSKSVWLRDYSLSKRAEAWTIYQKERYYVARTGQFWVKMDLISSYLRLLLWKAEAGMIF